MSEFYVSFFSYIVSTKHSTKNGKSSINMLGMKFGFLFSNSQISNPCGFPYCDYSTTQVLWKVINRENSRANSSVCHVDTIVQHYS